MGSAMKDDGVIPALCWRMDGKNSFSDWTIQVIRSSGTIGRPSELENATQSHSTDQEDTYHVHRAVLAFGPHVSDYFSGMLQMPWKESSSRTSRIELDEDQADVFSLFLDATYHGMVHERLDALTNTGQIITSTSIAYEDAVDRYGRVVVLSGLTLAGLWSLQSLFDYFGSRKLKGQLRHYVEEVRLKNAVYDESQFSYMMAKHASVRDPGLQSWYFQQILTSSISSSLNTCEKNAEGSAIVHKCSGRPHLCTEKLAVLAPQCMKVMNASKNTKLANMSRDFLLCLSDETLLQCGFVEAWCAKLHMVIAEGESFSTIDKKSAERIIIIMARSGNGMRDSLLEQGVLKSLSVWMMDFCPNKTSGSTFR